MTVLALGLKHGTLKRQTQVTDAAMGYTTTWGPLTAVRMRLNTGDSKIARYFKREGFENVLVIQAEDRLPTHVEGHTSLRRLLLDNTQERMRLDYDGRTLTIVGVSLPNDGRIHGAASVINIGCVETPQPVGIQDS